MKTSIEQLIEIFGNESKTAIALKMDRQVIHNWVKKGFIPYKNGKLIEEPTEGKIPGIHVWEDAARHH